ncbi:hypothetical protein ABZ960_37265 [Streptomyces pseudovenezuelae]|uniref:hypothetical protein n=1 Tax=Streptomyces pseudovenezuelae TaxID=67350 RepID=UPI0034A4070A
MPHRPHPSAPSPLWHARQQARRLDRAFLTSNAIGLAVTLGLGATTGDLLARRLPGTQATVGLLLYFAQAALLLVTALRFDRRCTRLLDPWQQAYARSGAEAADGGTGDAK